MSKPRFRVGIDGSNPRRMDASGSFKPWSGSGSGSFEAAGHGRRMRNFMPATEHINSAIQRSGRTIIKRARFLVENNGLAGNAVDVWVAWLVGDGIRPRVSGSTPERRAAIMKLWRRWAKEADAEGLTNLYGLQERAEREAFIAGE
jgi:capsid protein